MNPAPSFGRNHVADDLRLLPVTVEQQVERGTLLQPGETDGEPTLALQGSRP